MVLSLCSTPSRLPAGHPVDHQTTLEQEGEVAWRLTAAVPVVLQELLRFDLCVNVCRCDCVCGRRVRLG